MAERSVLRNSRSKAARAVQTLETSEDAQAIPQPTRVTRSAASRSGDKLARLVSCKRERSPKSQVSAVKRFKMTRSVRVHDQDTTGVPSVNSSSPESTKQPFQFIGLAEEILEMIALSVATGVPDRLPAHRMMVTYGLSSAAKRSLANLRATCRKMSNIGAEILFRRLDIKFDYQGTDLAMWDRRAERMSKSGLAVHVHCLNLVCPSEKPLRARASRRLVENLFKSSNRWINVLTRSLTNLHALEIDIDSIIAKVRQPRAAKRISRETIRIIADVITLAKSLKTLRLKMTPRRFLLDAIDEFKDPLRAAVGRVSELSLDLTGDYPLSRDWHTGFALIDAPYSYYGDRLWELLDSAAKVEALTLILSHDRWMFYFPQFPTLPSLKKLNLDGSMVPHADDLGGLAEHFPGLESVEFSNVSIHSGTTWAGVFKAWHRMPCLKSLSLHSYRYLGRISPSTNFTDIHSLAELEKLIRQRRTME